MKLLYCNTDNISNDFIIRHLALLPAEMEMYIRKFVNESDRKHRLLARLMLRHCLIQTTGSDKLLSEWQLDSNHKPFIPSWYEFSISHSGKFVIFAYDEHAIGVDIEKTNDIDYLSVADYLHSDEKNLLATSSYQKHDFYTIWTKKEAILKAIGIGISNELEQFSCLEQSVSYRNHEWFFYPLLIDTEYIGHVCSATGNATCTLEMF